MNVECTMRNQQLLSPINLIVSNDFHKAVSCNAINGMKQIRAAWKRASTRRKTNSTNKLNSIKK